MFQSTRVCERIDEVDCEKSEQFYHLNNELYGGMDPLIIREVESSDSAHTTPKTTSSSSTAPSTTTTTNPYFGTVKQTTSRQNIPSHYTSESSSDIRFDPKIINLQLNSDPSLGANIKPVSYQQQSYNDDQGHHTIVTTHSYKSDIPKTIYDNFKNQNLKPTDINYEFEYQDQQEQYVPPANRKQYHQIQNAPNYSPTAGELDDYSDDIFKGSTYRTVYHAPITKNLDSSTYKTPIVYTSSVNPQAQYSFERTEVPVKQQQQSQVTSPPSIFSALSSPAPFAHPHHLETKRNTDHHKIKKSFSLSISDQNGKELIKVNNTPISVIFSDSYLDYKDEEATLLPIFEDVPRIEKRRSKRNTETNKQVFKADPEATDVLKFLVDWYTTYEKTTKISIPLSSEAITEINDELYNSTDNENEMMENANKTSINETKSGGDLHKEEDDYYDDDDEYYYEDDIEDEKNNRTSVSITVSHKELDEVDILEKSKNRTDVPLEEVNKEVLKNRTHNYLDEYVDDNYEAETYQNNNNETFVSNNRTETAFTKTKKDGDNTEIDKNEIHKDVATTPNILYDYIDDNYESLSHTNNSEDVKNISSYSDEKELITSTLSTTTAAYTTAPNVEVNEIILTTDSILPTTPEEENTSGTTAHLSSSIHTNTAEVRDDLHIEREELNTEQTSQDNKILDEYLTTLETTTELLSTTGTDSSTTTLHYYSHLPTETTTDSIQITSTESTENYKSDNIITEVPISTSNYTAPIETTEQSPGVTTHITEKIYETTTGKVSAVIVKENLGEMIKDIEEETKSIAATIVMPEVKETLPSLSNIPKLENLTTERWNHVTTLPTITTTISEEITTTTQVSTSITTPKLIETTRSYLSRGRPYYSRRTTPRSSNHRFNIQQRRFDTIRNRYKSNLPAKTNEKSLRNHSVSDVNILLENSTINSVGTTQPNLTNNYNSFSSIDNNRTVSTPHETKLNLNNYTNHVVPSSKMEAITDASLSKSANPTLAKETKDFLATTPISKHIRVKLKKERVNKKYLFTCFGKKIDKFYSDPRDCRLFHYCSQGYTRDQLVDLKFVCDLGTYFDDVKLICTEEKPARCL